MITADGERCHPGGSDPGKQGLNVFDAVAEAVAAAERHVADVAGLDGRQRQEAVDMVVGPDALDRPHGPGAKASAWPVGDAEVQGDAYQRHVQAAEVGLLRRLQAQRRAEEGGNAFVRLRSAVGAAEDRLDGALELGVMGDARLVGGVFAAQHLELLAVHVALLHRSSVRPTGCGAPRSNLGHQ